MEDSGTMFIGFLMPYLEISFLRVSFQENETFVLLNGIVFALAVLSFPILDTLRVFTMRIKYENNPIMAGKNHINHRHLSLS